MSRETLARIDADALRHNLDVVRGLAPDSRVVSVVKADAYGHGVDLVLPGLDASDVLAVATVEELQAVRQAGWTGRLLLLEGFAGSREFDVAARTGAETVIHHETQLELLEARGALPGPRCWLKVDTGMHRLGFPESSFEDALARLQALDDGRPPILMSHFACADEPASGATAQQLERFQAVCDRDDLPVSLANSAGLLNFPESRRDYVRPGILLYGISPLAEATGEDHGLRPVMTLSTHLLAINTVPAGERVGYGGRFECPETLRIGVAGIGYGDGYPRAVPDGTPVLVNGRRAAIAGRVSMDMITIDLRGHDDARVGDEVILWGRGLPVETVARAAGMIPYELVCGITGRVRRVRA
ncbi:MAG: alanine racemase [Xanthomonadales bacterium]|jgi:alanine racemase|nr:alanine racemase [Xanthomonadales bacterium]